MTDDRPSLRRRPGCASAGFVAVALLAPLAVAAVSLQSEVDAAPPGSTLRLSGDYEGGAWIGKDLRLVDGDVRAPARILGPRGSGGVALGIIVIDSLARVEIAGIDLVDAAEGVRVESGIAELRALVIRNVTLPLYVHAGAHAVWGETRLAATAPRVDGSGTIVLGTLGSILAVDDVDRPIWKGRVEVVLDGTLALTRWESAQDGPTEVVFPTSMRERGAAEPLERLALRVSAVGYDPVLLPVPSAPPEATLNVKLTRATDPPTPPSTAAPTPASPPAPAPDPDAPAETGAPASPPPASDPDATLAEWGRGAWDSLGSIGRGLVAAATAGAAAAGAAWRATRDESRLSRALLLIAPLYARLARGGAAGSEAREVVRAHIRAHPGVHYRALRRAIGLPNGALAHHLSVLRRDGSVRVVREGQYLRFFPAGADPSAVSPIDTGELVLAAVRASPGATVGHIATSLGLAASVVSYHLDRLEAAGRLVRSRRGREVHLYPL